MSLEAELAAAGAAEPARLDQLARAALEQGEEEAALERLRPAADRLANATLWQWIGLLHRSLDEHERAIHAFEKAAELAPADPGIAHGRARVALEAGIDAVDLFIRARNLAPADGSVLLGLAAARNARGEGQLAVDELRSALAHAPAWLAGYEGIAQLLSTLGERGQATEPLEAALMRFPRQEELWLTLLDMDVRREDYGALARDVERASAAGVRPATLHYYRAVVAAESSEESRPNSLFGGARSELASSLAIWRVRHLLRVGDNDAALPFIDQGLSSGNESLWPYAATAWRLVGDPRSEWLENDPRLVQRFDLTDKLPPLKELADVLRRLHLASGEYLDQSVRGGTQTDGPLFSRIDPAIRQLRAAIVGAVEEYVGNLPAPDVKHPSLSRRRDRGIRFSGSWSVRLRSQGRHANHVHPHGWISSALYIALPERASGEREDAGWFTLGQPPDNLGLDFAPSGKIEPRPGQLVLFPSWMWHGTVPFREGERLTVAFDVRPPI